MTPLPRTLDVRTPLRRKSLFLFGPRATGKSTLIRQQVPDAPVINLLSPETYRRYLKRPSLLEELHDKGLVVIDEVQKLPVLLDEVHRLIEERKMTFLLTGSSARKLKRGGANLLAGRARWAELFPLTSHEIPNFDLLSYLNTGGLPAIYASPEAREDLRAYTSLYLKEEIQQEALTRNIHSFSEFLDLLALSNGEEVNYQSLANDLGISPNSVKNYIQILQDTLLAFSLSPFRKSTKRKAISRSKLYFFDVGVVNELAKRGEIHEGSTPFGKAFEHFIIMEIRAYLSYRRGTQTLSYWRTTSGFEVDLLVGTDWAFEIKSTTLAHDKHFKGLLALQEEGLVKNYAVISLDPQPRITAQGIRIFPWKVFLEKLWSDQVIDPKV